MPVPTGGDTQEKSAVRESLIRWKTVRFSIEGRVIAHSVFMLDYSSEAKLGNSFNHAKQHSDNSCVSVSSMFNPFGCHFIDGRYENNLSASVKNN